MWPQSNLSSPSVSPAVETLCSNVFSASPMTQDLSSTLHMNLSCMKARKRNQRSPVKAVGEDHCRLNALFFPRPLFIISIPVTLCPSLTETLPIKLQRTGSSDFYLQSTIPQKHSMASAVKWRGSSVGSTVQKTRRYCRGVWS